MRVKRSLAFLLSLMLVLGELSGMNLSVRAESTADEPVQLEESMPDVSEDDVISEMISDEPDVSAEEVRMDTTTSSGIEVTYADGVLTFSYTGDGTKELNGDDETEYAGYGIADYEATATAIVFGEGISSVAFPLKNFTALTEVTLGAEVSSVTADDLSASESLENIYVDEENAVYVSYNGILYSANGYADSDIVCYPNMSEATYYSFDTNSTRQLLYTVNNCMTNLGLTFEPIDAQERTGYPITPGVTFVWKSGTNSKFSDLGKTENYIVKYENNIEAGTATATVKGRRSFGGSYTLSFTIYEPIELDKDENGVYQISNFEELKQLARNVNKAGDGSISAKLTDDIDLGEEIISFNGSDSETTPKLMLDLDGHTLTGDKLTVFYIGNAEVTLKNGTVTTSYAYNTSEYVSVIYVNGGALTLNTVTLGMKDDSGIPCQLAVSVNSGTMTIAGDSEILGKVILSGSTFTMKDGYILAGRYRYGNGKTGEYDKKYDTEYKYCSTAVYAENNSTVNVEGGMILGGELSRGGSGFENSAIYLNGGSSSSLSITGGLIQGRASGIHVYGQPTVSISGGMILADGYDSSKGINIAALFENYTGDISITGGYFRAAPDAIDGGGNSYALYSIDSYSNFDVKNTYDIGKLIDTDAGFSYAGTWDTDHYTEVRVGRADYAVTINHYLMGTDGNYTSVPVTTEAGFINIDDENGVNYEAYQLPEYILDIVYGGFATAHRWVNWDYEFDCGSIDESTDTVNIYYKRKLHTTTVTLSEGIESITVQEKTYTNDTPGEPITVTVTPYLSTEVDGALYNSILGTIAPVTVTYEEGGYTLDEFSAAYETSDIESYASQPGYPFVMTEQNGRLSVSSTNENTAKITIEDYNADGTAKTFYVKKGLTLEGVDEPARTGYSFAGIYSQANGKGTKYYNADGTAAYTKAVTADTLTLYVYWQPFTYSISFNANDGGSRAKLTGESELFPDTILYKGTATGTMKAESLSYGTARTLTKASFTRKGYKFAGWNTSSDGTGTDYADGESVLNLLTGTEGYSNLTLYAKWTPEIFTITYDLGGAAKAEETAFVSTCYGGESVVLPTAEAFTADPSYVFDGWYISKDYKASEKVTEITVNQDYVLYAKWVSAKLTVNFDGNGNTSGTTASVTLLGGKWTNLTANGFKKTGYAFLGWARTNDAAAMQYANKEAFYFSVGTDGEILLCGLDVSSLLNDDGSLTLYAVWGNEFTIEYITDCDATVAADTYTYGKTHALDTTIKDARPGYTFTGWYDITGRKVSSISKTTYGNLILYAGWKANTYTVKYNKNGATSGKMSDSKFTYDTESALRANAFKLPGYRFLGWSTDKTATTPDYADGETVSNLAASGSVTLYAVWESTPYYITYDPCCNASELSVDLSEKLEYYYSETKILTIPERAGYTFAGWYKEASYKNKVTTTKGLSSDMTVYAKWDTTYTIVFDGNAGNYTDKMGKAYYTKEQTKVKYSKATVLTANPFKKEGYVFMGWSTNPAATTVTYTNKQKISYPDSSLFTTDENGNKTLTLYAVWKKTFIISYSLNGGTMEMISVPETYNYGEGITTLPTPVRDGYTFKGWYRDAKFKSQVKSISKTQYGDMTLYAKWAGNAVTVTFNSNAPEGTKVSGKMSKEKMTYGTSKALTSNAFKITGYTFLGWSEDPNATEASYTNKQKVSAIGEGYNSAVTLYAVWKLNEYTVTYKSDIMADVVETYTVNDTYSLMAAPSKLGYTFKGFYTDSKYKKAASDFKAGTTGNKTIYVKWTENK